MVDPIEADAKRVIEGSEIGRLSAMSLKEFLSVGTLLGGNVATNPLSVTPPKPRG
jgi:hypothetical protein